MAEYNPETFVEGVLITRSLVKGSRLAFDTGALDFFHEYRGVCDLSAENFQAILVDNLADMKRNRMDELSAPAMQDAYDAGLSACLSVADLYHIPHDRAKVRELRELYLSRIPKTKAGTSE